jgi:hypothetical protein
MESSRYLTNLRRAEAQLKISDFEQRPIEFIAMDQKHTAGKSVTIAPEAGVIAIWQPAGRLKTIPAMQTLHVLTAIEELLLRSSLIKLRRSQLDFGKQVIKILNDETDSPAQLAGRLVPWSCVVRHYAHQPAAYQQVFEPYLSPEDFYYHRPLDHLADIQPAFRWWANTAYVASHHKISLPISLNLMDVLNNYLGEHSYKQRTFSYFQQSLWQELFGRYLKHTAPNSSLNNWLINHPAFESLPITTEQQYQLDNYVTTSK